jgi:hypothetical protein
MDGALISGTFGVSRASIRRTPGVPVWKGVPVVLLAALLAVGGWASEQVSVFSGQNLALALVTVTVAGLLLLAARLVLQPDRRAFLSAVRTTLRERTLRTAFLPQRDPDAAGRPRPRAPGLEITTPRS